MRTTGLFIIVLLLSAKCFSITSPAIRVPTTKNNIRTRAEEPFLSPIASLKIKTIEKLLGRKLKLKEKIGFKLFQWRIRGNPDPLHHTEYKDQAKTALTFGVIGFVALLLSLLNPIVLAPAICFGLASLLLGKKARKQDPNNKKAKSAIWLGWLTLGLFAAAAVFIVIFLISINGGIK